MKRLILIEILLLIASFVIGCEPQRKREKFEPFSFAVITDLHIGRDIHNSGIQDYGAPGFADYNLTTGQALEGNEGGFNIRTDRLVATVDWLNANHRKGNIKFLVILGDITDTAEMSEFFRAKKILDNLEIPYIPLIGNHDVWSHVGELSVNPWAEGGGEIGCRKITSTAGQEYFEKILWNKTHNKRNIEQVKELFSQSWQRQEETEGHIGSPYYQNFVFNYQEINFLALDYARRDFNCLASLAEPFSETKDWLKENLERHKGEVVLVFSHYPYLVPKGGFLQLEVDKLLNVIVNNGNKVLTFAGHIHASMKVNFGGFNFEFRGENVNKTFMVKGKPPAVPKKIEIPVIITKGMTEEDTDFLRIVRVKGSTIGEIDYSNEPLKSFDSGGIVTIEIGEQTPTSTITLTSTPILTCPPEGEPKFTLEEEVITTDALRVRKSPGPVSPETEIKTQPKGTSGKVLEGPVCAHGYIWWKIEYQDGTIGWSVENWLERVPRIKTPTPVVEIPTLLPETPTFTPTITPTPIAEIRGKIAFVSDRDGNAEIYLMNADGTNQVNLTNHPAGDWDPAWSPDGKKIAFVSDRDGDAEIYVMDANGNLKQQLTNNSVKDEEPDWSPDGKYIIFTSERDGNDEIYIMNSDGSDQRNLTNFSEPDLSPRWSPDGQKIVFTSQNREKESWLWGDYFLYTMNPDGSGISPLSEDFIINPGGASFKPKASDWSPNGRYIAYSEIYLPMPSIITMSLYDTEDDFAHLIGKFMGNDIPGTFSPDGEWLAFASNRDDKNAEIYLIHIETKEIQRLTENKAHDWDPAWIAP